MNIKRALLILLMAAFIMPSIALAQEVTTARFVVTKVFADGFDGEVEVTITCNTGIPLVQSAMISEGNPVGFVVEEFIIVDVEGEGATNCEIVEDGETGYVANYDNDYSDSSVSCLFSAADDTLDGELNLCDITNTPAPVTVSLTKEWDISGAVNDEVDTTFYMYVHSYATIIHPNAMNPCYEGDEYNCLYLHYEGSATQTQEFGVIPSHEGEDVYIYEDIYDSSVESTNNCGGGYEGMEGHVTVYPGQGASCTFTNTVFFEGIPTLSQYGLAIMALLMLGVGFVGFRRFV